MSLTTNLFYGIKLRGALYYIYLLKHDKAAKMELVNLFKNDEDLSNYTGKDIIYDIEDCWNVKSKEEITHKKKRKYEEFQCTDTLEDLEDHVIHSATVFAGLDVEALNAGSENDCAEGFMLCIGKKISLLDNGKLVVTQADINKAIVDVDNSNNMMQLNEFLQQYLEHAYESQNKTLFILQ